MSRRRYVSSDISTDPRIAELAEHGTLPVLLYTWAITHADDWGRLTGDARQFKLLVCPGLEVTTQEVDTALSQIAAVGLWLRYTVAGRGYLAFPTASWMKYQTYIGRDKRLRDGSQFPAPPDAVHRRADSSEHLAEQPIEQHMEQSALNASITAKHRTSPRITAERRETPQNTVSPSPSPTPSPTTSPSQLVITDEQEIERENVRAECAGAVSDATLAADAALSLSAPAPTSVSPQPPQSPQSPQSAASPRPATLPATKRKPAKVTPLRVPGARVRDVVWDACIASMGAAPSNSVERGKWAKGIKALRESLSPPLADGSPGPDITAEIAAEIGVRARRYRMRYGSSVPLNPMALAGNWSQLAHDIPAQTTHQEGQRYGHAAGHAGQFTRQASSGYTGQRRSNGKPAIGTTEYYAQALLAQQQSQQQGRNAAQAGWSHTGGRAGEDDATAAIGIG